MDRAVALARVGGLGLVAWAVASAVVYGPEANLISWIVWALAAVIGANHALWPRRAAVALGAPGLEVLIAVAIAAALLPVVIAGLRPATLATFALWAVALTVSAQAGRQSRLRRDHRAVPVVSVVDAQGTGVGVLATSSVDR